MQEEFSRHITTLVEKGYPEAAGLSSDDFRTLIEPLRARLPEMTDYPVDYERGTLPFVIVVTRELVPVAETFPRVERNGKRGVEKLFPRVPDDFATIPSVRIPGGTAYLLVDIDRGQDTLNVTPEEAMKHILAEGRSPLTLEEGIAVVTHYPDFLMKNNCFSLLASRTGKDQRVPAIWINGKNHPNLGWCWDRNPHTWLGSASCGRRLGVSG
jgi:hypothetical protein